MHIHISPYLFPLVSPSLPPSLSHPSRWSQSTELISLCSVAASHSLAIFGRPFLFCAFDTHFILIFLSSLLLEAARAPLCWSAHSLLLWHLLVIFICNAIGIHILSAMSLLCTYQHYSCHLLDRCLWKLVNISLLL